MSYASQVAHRLDAVTPGLAGVYLGGSLALGDYLPGRSDVDIAAVTAGPLSVEVKDAIVGAVRHESLPCPARGLELVVYREEVARGARTEPGYELDLNTGPRMAFRASVNPVGADPHWYAIDRAIVAAHGEALHGPPAREMFAAAPRSQLVPLLAVAVRWHATSGVARTDDAVLNACRALRFVRTGEWVSKRAAGEWALGTLRYGPLAGDALRARRSGCGLGVGAVGRFLAAAESELASL